MDDPTSCCNVPRRDCEPWPTFEIFKVFKFVGKQDLYSPDGQRQAIVFLCAMLEMLLEITLWELLEIHAAPRELAEVILEGYHGRNKRIELYNRLSHRSLKTLFKSNKDLKTFHKDWESIAKVRNDIVHSGDYSKLDEVVSLIPSILERSLSAFAEANNDIQQMRADIT
jgi:hypothetical protein